MPVSQRVIIKSLLQLLPHLDLKKLRWIRKDSQETLEYPHVQIGDTSSSWVNFSIAMLLYQRVSHTAEFCGIFQYPNGWKCLWKKSVVPKKSVGFLSENGIFFGTLTHIQMIETTIEVIKSFNWRVSSGQCFKQIKIGLCLSPLEIPMKMWMFS